MSRLLSSLGVTPDLLTEKEKQQLDELGYLLLPAVIDNDWLLRLRESFEELIVAEGEQAGSEYIREAGTRRLSDLMNKGEVFDGVWGHPKVLAAVHHIIGRPFRLDMLNGRDTLPGQGLQNLHADWGPRQSDERFHAVNSIWLLDDFTPENGPTRLVPRTHRLPGLPDQHLDDPLLRHPDEIRVIAPAGTVLVYNAHLWHGGTQNNTGLLRRCLHCFFIANEFERPFRRELTPETRARLSAAARSLLGDPQEQTP